jgi:hypothetical protein
VWFDVLAALLRKTIFGYEVLLSFPVAARSKAWFCGRSLAGIAGSNPTGVKNVYCVFSGRGLCVNLNTRPEESYLMWCV